MDCASEFKVSTETDGMAFKATLEGAYCKKVCKSLCRMAVPTVSCVDDWNRAVLGCKEGSSFLWSAHGNHVNVGTYYADCVGKGLSLCSACNIGISKTLNSSA